MVNDGFGDGGVGTCVGGCAVAGSESFAQPSVAPVAVSRPPATDERRRSGSRLAIGRTKSLQRRSIGVFLGRWKDHVGAQRAAKQITGGRRVESGKD
jgi:hypothetical protein